MAAVVALLASACSSEVAANQVEVGTCTNTDLGAAVGEIDSVDCGEPHSSEVFAVFDLAGDEYPGDNEIFDLAIAGCTGPRFEDYVGLPFEQSIVFVNFLPPNEKTWNDADDRTVICVAVTEDGSQREGSVRNLNQ